MAYSKNPFNYPPAMHRLVSLFETAPDTLPLNFPSHHDAYKFQMQFYGFIRALTAASEKAFKLKDTNELNRWKDLEALARTRKVSLQTNPDTSTTWTLSFTRRDADPIIQSINDQLSNISPPLSIEPPAIHFEETKLPDSLRDFFTPSPSENYTIEGPTNPKEQTEASPPDTKEQTDK